mgnify:CR=1 FL=1
MAQNLTYTKCGDYYIPDIRLAHIDAHTLGKYGRMLWEVQQTCEKRMELLMADLLLKNPAPDKTTQQLAWVSHMNSLKAQAEEIILRELIYEEDVA